MHHLSTSHLDWDAAPSVWAAPGNPRSAGGSQGATGQQSPAKLPTSTEADGLEAPTRQKCPPFKGGEDAAIKQWAILNTARTSQLHGTLSCEQSLQCLLPGQVQLPPFQPDSPPDTGSVVTVSHFLPYTVSSAFRQLFKHVLRLPAQGRVIP